MSIAKVGDSSDNNGCVVRLVVATVDSEEPLLVQQLNVEIVDDDFKEEPASSFGADSTCFAIESAFSLLS